MYWAYQGRLGSKLHALRDGEGRPIVIMLPEGQMSDHKGYDSDRFRAALKAR